MTLRRFMVLVRGLGPQSATIAALQSEHYLGDGTRVREARTADEADRMAEAFFGGGKVH
ncbi:MAG TPA: hypothetical protein VFI34_07665 [Candidatus Limnocylindrales bacterium]|nr:hypothetical protein [Candidatus Limnocylindrales bacterium]